MSDERFMGMKNGNDSCRHTATSDSIDITKQQNRRNRASSTNEVMASGKPRMSTRLGPSDSVRLQHTFPIAGKCATTIAAHREKQAVNTVNRSTPNSTQIPTTASRTNSPGTFIRITTHKIEHPQQRRFQPHHVSPEHLSFPAFLPLWNPASTLSKIHNKGMTKPELSSISTQTTLRNNTGRWASGFRCKSSAGFSIHQSTAGTIKRERFYAPPGQFILPDKSYTRLLTYIRVCM